MEQPRGSPVPPTMIPTPVGTRLSRSSTTSSGRYYSRSTLGSSSSNTSGRTRSISATYSRTSNGVASMPLFSKRASTGSHYSLLRKVVGRSTAATTDDAGYESDYEEQPAFDAVNTLKIRFNRSPKTPATLRALRIMEQRTGISSAASADVTDGSVRQVDAEHGEKKELVEDWSDDYDIPETANCIVDSESPKSIPAFPLHREVVCTNITTTAEEAMHDPMKYEPLIAPVDALSNGTDTFLSQGGFTRGSSVEDLNHIPDNSLDIEEMMARHADFADATQLLNKTEHLDFSTTSFQVWRDVPSSLSIDSFSNSLIMTPAANHDNNPFVRAPLQQKTLIRRTPSKLRNVIEITPPKDPIEAGVPQIVLQDATEGSVSPDAFPSRIFETYPSGASTLPIWVDSVSFFTALESPSESDLLSLGAQRFVGETRNQLDSGTSAAKSPTIGPPPSLTTVGPVPIPDSNLRGRATNWELNESTPIAPNDSLHKLATIPASNSGAMSEFSLSLAHYQLEATVMAPPSLQGELGITSYGSDGPSISPAECTSVFPMRLPGLQQGLTGETLGIRAIIQTEHARSGLVSDDQHDVAVSSALSRPAETGPRPGMSTLPSILAECDFPTIESLVSLPDFYEFSNSVPMDVLAQPPTVLSLFGNINDAQSSGSLNFEDTLLRSLPVPITELSAEEARDWGRVVEVCVVPTMSVDTRYEVASTVTASRAPSCMDETPLDGGILTLDDASGLRSICEQEEDFILPAPLSANNVPEFIGLVSKDPFPEHRDSMCEVAVFIARADSTVNNHQNTLPSSPLAGVVGIDNIILDSPVSSAESSLPPRPSPYVIPGLQITNTPHVQELPQEAVLQVKLDREEHLMSPTSRDRDHTRRRVSAIERWRQACAKSEILSLSQMSKTHEDYPLVEGLSASIPVPRHLCRFVSSPPCTQQYPSLIAVTQAAHASVSRARSLLVGHTTYQDARTCNTDGCARKRRSRKTRSAPKSSFLSKASSIPRVLRGNTSGTALTESSPELGASSTSAPHSRSSFFVEGFEISISECAQRFLLQDEGQNITGAPTPPIGTATKNPSSRDNADVSILEGWENADMSFWGSPRSGKRKRFRDLFKRPSPPEGYVAASTTPSGPGHSTGLSNPSASRNNHQCLSLDPNHHSPRCPPRDTTPDSPLSPTPVPSNSPKKKHLGLNWISRSRASALFSSSAKPTTSWSPDTETKPKGGRLGAVVHKLQSFL